MRQEVHRGPSCPSARVTPGLTGTIAEQQCSSVRAAVPAPRTGRALLAPALCMSWLPSTPPRDGDCSCHLPAPHGLTVSQEFLPGLIWFLSVEPKERLRLSVPEPTLILLHKIEEFESKICFKHGPLHLGRTTYICILQCFPFPYQSCAF